MQLGIICIKKFIPQKLKPAQGSKSLDAGLLRLGIFKK